MIFLLALLLQTDDPRPLIEKLRSDKPEERAAAAEKLKYMGRPAVPALEEAVKSPSLEVREQAKYILKVIPLREKFSSVLYGLMPDAEDRLARGGVEAWTEVLMDTLKKDKDGDPIHTTLRKSDLEALAEPVVAGEKNRYLRAVALQLVVDWKLKGVLPTVAKVLEDPDPAMRVAAAQAIGRFGAREFMNPLILALRDPDAKVVAAAIDALKPFWPAPEDFIVPLLGDVRVEVRGHAFAALKGNDKHAHAIAALLKDVDLHLRAAAALALGEMSSGGHIPALVLCLDDGDPGVRRAALWSLGVLDAKEAVEAITARFADPEPSVRARAAEAVAKIGMKEKKLLALLDDPDDDVAFRTAWSLGELGFGEAELRKALTSARPRLAGGAAVALGRMGAEDAIPGIVALTKPGSDSGTRWLAATALGGLGGADELRKLLDDSQATVRWAAAQSLGRLNQDADYKKLLADADADVRVWAGLALARRGLRDGVETVLQEAPKPWRTYLWLNRLHSPKSWNRLENTALDEVLEGTADELLEKLVAKSKLGWSVRRQFAKYRSQPRYRLPAGIDLLTALDRLLFWSRSEYVSDAPSTRVRLEIVLTDTEIQVTDPQSAITTHKQRLK